MDPKAKSAEDAAGANGDSAASSPSASVNSHLAQALKDLARGEETAAALEANLTSLENKLEELLASFDVPDLEKSLTPAQDSHGEDAESTKGAPDGKEKKNEA